MPRRAPATKRVLRPLTAASLLILVRGDRVDVLSADDVTLERVGNKAYGIASLPPLWTKPYFVVSGELPAQSGALQAAVDQSGIRQGVKVIVRSSAVGETIHLRGQLESVVCEQAGIKAQVDALASRATTSSKLHFVVQELAGEVAKGHLSNERRVAQDKRDWVAEIEAATRSLAELHRIPLRDWRDRRPPATGPLRCVHRESIVSTLALVARWTYERLIRVHFEWVWDGASLYIVQADACEDVINGCDPHDLVQKTGRVAGRRVARATLEVFRGVGEADFSSYRKLANTRLYESLGYKPVPFFVLDSKDEIDLILNEGRCSDALHRDLEKLTAEPLVIRTDGKAIPADLRDMLPRSDELRSAAAAISWLTSTFREKALKKSMKGEAIADGAPCLIAHHFVPAVASAWCQAAPTHRRVRIESLWGIPEGLYWYTHDVFDVDTTQASATGTEAQPPHMSFRSRTRYKEHFVAPNSDGAWVLHRTGSKADWARSIKRTEWIHEIAWTTRCIATRTGGPVVVMWLIDTPRRSTPHRVLPWYHLPWKHEGPRHKAAPRRKLARSADLVIETRADWEAAQRALAGEGPIARIRVDPREPEMVRNPQFVENLAQVAKKHGCVVELSGGILSHAYYMLARAGCQVECLDLDEFAFEEEALEFNKLVRDRVPEAIEARGERVALMRLEGDALSTSLRRKVVEEALEVLDARTSEQIAEELADLREVVLALMRELGIQEAHVEAARRDKSKSKGAFAEGIMLRRTSMPAPLGTQLSGDLLEDQPLPMQTITQRAELPSTTIEDLHVDQRRDASGKVERQLTTIIPVHASGASLSRASFQFETQDGHPHEVVAEVVLDRQGSELRVRLRLVNAPKQEEIDLDQ